MGVVTESPGTPGWRHHNRNQRWMPFTTPRPVGPTADRPDMWDRLRLVCGPITHMIASISSTTDKDHD